MISDLGSKVSDMIRRAQKGQKLPTEGNEQLLNYIHRRMRDALYATDPLPLTDPRHIQNRTGRYSDILNIKDFNQAVRRDPAFFAIRGGAGVGLEAVNAVLGSPIPTGWLGASAPFVLEPSIFYTLFGTAPRAAGKFGPTGVRAMMREPEE